MQVIRSLDELVSDIEDTRAHPASQFIRMPDPLTTPSIHYGLAKQQRGQSGQAQPSVSKVLADVAQQLSLNCDLHDTLICQ